MMRLLSRATGSALQALGNSNDPAAAFAQDFLGSVMSGLPMPQARPAATRDAREATLALLDKTFGNTARDPRDTLLLAAGLDAGVWTESLSLSFDFGRGYAEGSGMSLLQTGEASSIALTFHSGRLNCERALFGGLAPPPFWIQSQMGAGAAGGVVSSCTHWAKAGRTASRGQPAMAGSSYGCHCASAACSAGQARAVVLNSTRHSASCSTSPGQRYTLSMALICAHAASRACTAACANSRAWAALPTVVMASQRALAGSCAERGMAAMVSCKRTDQRCGAAACGHWASNAGSVC